MPDESGWKEQHAEHCSPDPADIAARARAEAFEECARIAEAYFPQDFQNDISRTCQGIAAEIRRRAKP